MGLFKKKTPEEIEQKAKVDAAFREAYNKEEIKGAHLRGAREGRKAGETKQNSGVLATISRIAEGSLYGVNKGAEAFNKGVGLQDFNLQAPKTDTAVLNLPVGNDDIFFGSNPVKKKRSYSPDW